MIKSRIFLFLSFFWMSAGFASAQTTPTCLLTFDKYTINKGGTATLSWASTNADGMYITKIGFVLGSGSKVVSPSETTDYFCKSYTVRSGYGPVQTARLNVANTLDTALPTIPTTTVEPTNATTISNDLRLTATNFPVAFNNNALKVNPIGTLVNIICTANCGNGAFLGGITGGYDGRIVYLRNLSTGAGQLTIANENQWETVPADRINISGFAPNGTAIFANGSVLQFMYSGTLKRWTLVDSNFQTGTGDAAQTFFSDINLKQDIATITDISAKFPSLDPITFRWNEKARLVGENSTQTQYSYVAQDLQKVFPELVSTSSTGYLQINVQGLNIYTVSVVKSILNITSLFRKNLIFWLADRENGVVDFFAQNVYSQKLCLKDAYGESCYTRAQLDSALKR